VGSDQETLRQPHNKDHHHVPKHSKQEVDVHREEWEEDLTST